VNVPQENNDDVAMPDIALHEAIANVETGRCQHTTCGYC
jgi:hypothetical protein